MKCLNCENELINHTVKTRNRRVSYFLCPTCESLWLPKGELDHMADRVEGSVELSTRPEAQAESTSRRRCPSCDMQTMQSVHFLEYSDVLLDYCRRCEGFWLDAGELDRINEELNKLMDVKEPGFANFIRDVHRPYWRKRIREEEAETEEEEEPDPDEHRPLPPLREAEFLESTYLNCPACGDHLDRYEAFDIRIEGCPNCHGMWLKQDELRQLKDRAEGPEWSDLRWVDDEIEAIETSLGMPSRRHCPVCPEQKLATVEFGFSDVLIDFCPNCRGTWLDEAEFFDIMAYLKKQLTDLSTDGAVDRLKHELSEILHGPEGTLSELQDAKAAASTLINLYLFNHPKLFKFLSGASSLFS